MLLCAATLACLAFKGNAKVVFPQTEHASRYKAIIQVGVGLEMVMWVVTSWTGKCSLREGREKASEWEEGYAASEQTHASQVPT